jgi:hypothetical protein
MPLAVTTSVKELRGWGLVWIILGPVLYLMGSLSKWTSDLKLAVFLGVAVAGLLFGVAALLGQAWSVTGLFVLSSLVAAYSFGLGVLGFIWSAKVVLILRIGMAALAAAWGIPFLYMALAIRSLARQDPVTPSRPAEAEVTEGPSSSP